MEEHYLTRDEDKGMYKIFAGRPGKDLYGEWEAWEGEDGCKELFELCTDDFRAAFGRHPVKPGRIKKIESITFNFKPLK